MRPAISFHVMDKEQGQDAKIVVTCYDPGRVVLGTETHKALMEWFASVLASNAVATRVEIYEDGELMLLL